MAGADTHRGGDNPRPAGRTSWKALASITAQGLTALASLGLQVVAAHHLGMAEFGAFAVLLGLLVAASALFIGYVGDGLAVLDRHDPTTRSALVTSTLGICAVGAAVAIGAVLVIRGGDLAGAAAYAVMLVTWLLREALRRLFMARLEFGRLVVNDVVYLLAVFAPVLWLVLSGSVSLTALFGAMAFGAIVGIVVGVAVLPASELRELRPRLDGMRELAGFAGWRSAQAVLRPAALLLARLLVGAALSLAAVGALEAGRLVVAPLQVVVNGVGGFLLAGFAARERARPGSAGASADRAAVALTAVIMLSGGVAASVAGPLGSLMTGAPVGVALVLAWSAYLATWAGGLPYVSECVARRQTREVFLIRVGDSVLGLALVAVALLAGGPLVLVPLVMALGGVYSVLRLRTLAVRGRAADAETVRRRESQ